MSFLYRFVRALVGSRRTHRKAAPKAQSVAKYRNGMLQLNASADSDLVRKLRELAANGDGGVTILEPSGRRTTPNELIISPLSVPTRLVFGPAFVSASVSIDGVGYGFHAYAHPRATAHSRYWLYYVVTGPSNKDGSHGEFEITDEFKWTGERPHHPLLVKSALRDWLKRPEVARAIEAARRNLPRELHD